jgi:competence protein ComEC
MSLSEADTTGPPATKGFQAWLWSASETWQNAIPQQSLFLWSPVLLAAGIGAYFSLAIEPSIFLASVLFVIAATLIFVARGKLFATVLAILLAGFSAAKLRTEIVYTPMLRAPVTSAHLTGTVSKVERKSPKRQMLTINVESLSNVPSEEMPSKIHVMVFGNQPNITIGDHIRLTARLRPLPRPVKPGAFDYARQLYFMSVGATGEAIGSVEIEGRNSSIRYASDRFFASLRTAIHARISDAIPEPLASFANALITGDRSAIPKSINDSLQKSGLAHILSISGLHMALVAGGVFTLVRALLAMSAALALTRPIKKYAAAVAMVVGLFYMMLADSGSATERSYIMIAIVFFAIIVDRPAISMHNLALAAIIILLIQPEQVLSASFQMSFMAVMGLAALFEWWSKLDRDRAFQKNTTQRLWIKGRNAIVLAILTSIVAGVLSGIPAAHHFGRLAPYSVAANAVALPITSFIVMPAALLSVFTMPLDLDWLPLKAMQFGLDLTVRWSDWINSWPGSGFRLPHISTTAAITLALGAAVICIGRFKGILLGVAAATALGGVFISARQPDLLIDDKSQNVAVRGPDGILEPMSRKSRGFAVRKWLEAAGQNSDDEPKMLWSCDPLVCLTESKGRKVAVLRREAEALKPCPSADILVSEYPLRKSCRGLMATIDRFDVWRGGSQAVYLTEREAVIETAKELQGRRPWSYDSRPRG